MTLKEAATLPFLSDTRFLITGFTLFGKPQRSNEFQSVSHSELIQGITDDFNPSVEYIRALGDNFIELNLSI